MLRSLFLLPCCLAPWLVASEPVLQVVIPDAQRMQVRLASGPMSTLLSHADVTTWLTTYGGVQGQAVRAALAAAAQIRIEAEDLGRFGGLPSARLVAAAVSPADLPVAGGPPGLIVQRAGAWYTLGWPVAAQRRPETYAPSGALAGADLLFRCDVRSCAALLSAERAQALSALCEAWQVADLRGQIDLATQRGALQLPGAVLPLRPIDPAALAGVPPSADLVVAVGLGADGWSTVADHLCQTLGIDNAAITERFGLTSAELLSAASGTIWAAIDGVSGERLLSLPASADLVTALRRGIASLHPEPGPLAEAEADGLMAQAREQAIALPVQGSLLFVHVAHGRIWLASSGRVLAGVQAEAPNPPPEDGAWGGGASIQVRWSDRVARHLAPTAAPATPWQGLLRVVASAGLPAGSVEMRSNAGGLEISGPLALTAGAALVLALPTLAPAWLEDYEAACATLREAALKQVVARAKLFATSTSGHWPRDLADLRARAADLSPEFFVCAGRPDLVEPFIYVQPMFGAPDEQPVLVQDPAANGGRGSLVGFVDGRVEFRAGLQFWQEARRLVTLPAVREQGAAPSEWATMPKVF